jgi:hypothetical protein
MGSPEPRRRHRTRRHRRCTLMASHAAAISHSRLGPPADLGGGTEGRGGAAPLACYGSADRGEAERGAGAAARVVGWERGRVGGTEEARRGC